MSTRIIKVAKIVYIYYSWIMIINFGSIDGYLVRLINTVIQF